MGTPIEPTPDNLEVQGTDDNAPGPNPAWNDVLSVLPEQFHQMVTPHFQKWDQAAQAKIEQVNDSLKQFDDYKPFVEHGINAQEVEQGLRLMYEINNNPQGVYDALQKAYNFGQQTSSADPNASAEDDDETIAGLDPDIANKLQQQEGMLQAVAQIVLNDAQAKQAAQADIELDKELSALKERIGDYDERYVLGLMQTGLSADEAGDAFTALKTSLAQNKPFAPNVLSSNSGGGAGLPSNAIDPTKLSGKDTRNLVAQMLAAEFGKQG